MVIRHRAPTGSFDLPQLYSESSHRSAQLKAVTGSEGVIARSASASAIGERGSRPALRASISTPIDRASNLKRSSSIPTKSGGLGNSQKPPFNRSLSGGPNPIEGLAAVLFLDVDGVLHSVQVRHPRQQFARDCMSLLAEVLAATDATIVLSTAWRIDPEADLGIARWMSRAEARRIVAEKLEEHGLPQFVSRTPNIAMFHRSREILAWVRRYRPATWVAMDDLPLLDENEQMQGHFVQTRARTGLQQDTAERIISLFKAQSEQLKQQREHSATLKPFNGAFK